MALNFPDSPSTNEYFTDNTSGFTYQWNGVVWISVASTQTTSLKEFDDIAGSFNSSTTTFALTFGAGSTKVYPLSVNQITIVIGGILQNAGDDYTVSGDQITFTTPPDAGLTFQGMFYGSSVSMNSAAAGSIGTAAFSTGGPIWNIGGDVTVAGIVTVGSSSVVIDGPSNEIRVGTGATVNASGIVIGGAGIVTASYFYGDGSGLDGIVSGIGSTGSINTSGIITASSFSGSGLNITNIGGQLSAITYSPGIGATGVAEASNIVITFNKPVKSNTGTITLKEGAADGTTVESFDVETSDKITISGGQITIDPTSNFGAGTSFYVAVPSGAYKDVLNTSSSTGISTYSFQTAESTGTPGLLFSAGRNDYGQVGNNTSQAWPGGTSSPAQIPGTQWTSISRGRTRGFGIKSDKTLWAWGENTQGRLGQNSDIHYSSPVQIGGTAWSTISSGYHSSFAIKTDKTLWAWGLQSVAGELGQNDKIDRSSPIQIPGTQWSSISGGEYFASAVKDDGSLWTFGYNQQGQLGLNSRVSYSSPTQIPGTWSKIDNGRYEQIGQKTDGTLWAWGQGGSGILAQSNLVNYSSPVQIPGTQWNDYMQNRDMAIASKTDETIWVWGNNGSGQLGLNSQVKYSSPVQLPGNWKLQDKNSYGSTVFATLTKTDGTLWAWGSNYAGSFGLNNSGSTNRYRSSPIQIPGTQWIDVAHADYTFMARKSV